MKRILILFIIFSAISPLRLYSHGLSTAQEYGESMKQWSATGDYLYRETIVRICDGIKSTRVADEIAMDLAYKNGQPENISYELNSYLNWIDKVMSQGISIEISDYNVVSRYEIEGSNAHETKYAQESDKYYVSCRVKIRGALSYDVYDLICMRNNKITKIAKYEKSGNKVKVNFSDIDFDVDDDQMIGFSYNYAKNFPIGVSATYSISNFMISLDFGLNTSNDKTVSEKLNMTNVLNYDYKKTEFDPKMYFTITPAYYMKYFSVGCGLGGLLLDRTKIESSCSGDTSANGLSQTEVSEGVVKFMLRPVIKGYIPVNDNKWAISAGVGYDIVFGYKKMNGINFSVGLLFNIE